LRYAPERAARGQYARQRGAERHTRTEKGERQVAQRVAVWQVLCAGIPAPQQQGVIQR